MIGSRHQMWAYLLCSVSLMLVNRPSTIGVGNPVIRAPRQDPMKRKSRTRTATPMTEAALRSLLSWVRRVTSVALAQLVADHDPNRRNFSRSVAHLSLNPGIWL